nr:MAG TPA: hypothetical protein [Caudoviricetes sp.]
MQLKTFLQRKERPSINWKEHLDILTVQFLNGIGKFLMPLDYKKSQII